MFPKAQGPLLAAPGRMINCLVCHSIRRPAAGHRMRADHIPGPRPRAALGTRPVRVRHTWSRSNSVLAVRRPESRKISKQYRASLEGRRRRRALLRAALSWRSRPSLCRGRPLAASPVFAAGLAGQALGTLWVRSVGAADHDLIPSQGKGSRRRLLTVGARVPC